MGMHTILQTRINNVIKMNDNKKKTIRFLLIAAPLIVADQVTKWLVVRSIEFGESIEIIPGFFYLTHLYNTGGAFGLFAGSALWVRVLFLLVMSVIAAIIVLVLYRKTPYESRFFAYALCLVFAGAAGNLIDRFRLGKVVDFLEFYISAIDWRLFNPWPPFNVADSAITVGVTILAFYFISGKDPL